MRLSFNIPTYNRAKYLKQNLAILTAQIKGLHKEEEVEINISDNASTDDTRKVSEECIAANPQLHISYHRNEKNLGPDGNFIAAMHLARGEYSLLWGDDDFLKEGGLARIFELTEYGDSHDVQIMLSSTSVYDKDGKYKTEKIFLREDIDEITVDFSDLTQARAYFFLLTDMGGMLSFISDVVYKTAIIKEIPFDEKFMGTHYAFLCYWWGWLAKGKKLYYSNRSFLKETVQYQPAYGYGVDRVMVDYNGYTLIANKFFKENELRRDFLTAFQNLHNALYVFYLVNGESDKYNKLLVPKLEECGVSCEAISEAKRFCGTKSTFKLFLYTIVPAKVLDVLKKFVKR
jgi:abequosyltransferase